MKRFGLIFLLVTICVDCVLAEKFYDVYSISGTAWVQAGNTWQSISKDDIVSENATVKINSNTTAEFADNCHVYTINMSKRGVLKDLIAWVNKQTTVDKFIDNRRSDRLHRVGLVTVRDSVVADSKDVISDDEIYIIFYDSGRSLTAYLLADDMKEFEKVEISEREAILNLLDECRASGKGLEPIYHDTRLYSMLWSEIEHYLKDNMTIIFEVPQYLYSIDMEKVKTGSSIEMGKKYKMHSIEPKL